jgi:shikimate kinase
MSDLKHNNSQFRTPNSKKILFLVGMPAAGKTYWGSRVAHEFDLQFIDLDIFIEEKEKASISALFATYGENGFRERENKYLKELIKKAARSTIIACGGGTPCFNDNLQLMKEAGIVIYLRADIPALISNLEASEELRPLLKGRGDMAIYLQGLLQKRIKFYEQAEYILQTKDISLTTFAEIISSCTNKQ